jgi:hypothetical protein
MATDGVSLYFKSKDADELSTAVTTGIRSQTEIRRKEYLEE